MSEKNKAESHRSQRIKELPGKSGEQNPILSAH
jgi:hypothetical protein